MLDDVFPVPARALIRQGGRACFYRLVNTSPLLIQVQSGTKIVMAYDKALRLEAGAYGLLPDYRPLTMENIPKAPQKYQTLALPVPRQLFEEAYIRMGSIAVPSRPVPAGTSDLPEEAAALFDYCCQPGNLDEASPRHCQGAFDRTHHLVCARRSGAGPMPKSSARGPAAADD